MTTFFFNELDPYTVHAEKGGSKIVTEFCSDQPIIVAPVQSKASASCTFAYVGQQTRQPERGEVRDTIQSS
jgi:hypothetical protein